MARDTRQLFELAMLGGAIERRYRAMRPDIEQLPWGTLHASQFASPALIAAARRSWTLAAFQEHRTGAACAATIEALIAARAPVDLIATATRFPLDELAHVEMCARLAMDLGGGVPLSHSADLVPHPDPALPPLLRAAELVVRVFCVGEAISIPLLRGTARASTHPLIKQVMNRIVKDEAAHGRFGWLFLDWAEDHLGPDEKRHLATIARDEIGKLERSWDAMRPGPEHAADVHALGWMESQAYLDLARRTVETDVKAPLRARGLLEER